jgi:hypothetical protein
MAGGEELSTSERAELERLRAEVVTLRRRTSGRAGRAWRWVGSTVLLVLAALLFSVSTLAIFVRTQLLDTDRYVETVAPLARDPVVQDAIANRVTDEFMVKLDIAGLTQQLVTALEERGVPPIVNELVGPMVSGVRNFVHTEVHNVVTSDRFAQVWDSANRVAHDELDAILTSGKGEFLTAEGTQISLNVGALLTIVKQRLVDAGFGLAARVPDTNITVPLFHVEQLPRIRTAVSILNTLYWLLPLVALLLLLAGVLVAPNRRRALLIGSLAFAIGLLLLLGGMAAARSYYLNNLPDTIKSPDAVRVVFDTETRFLVQAIKTLATLFGIIALLCLIFGPSQPAVLLRRLVDRGLDAGGGALARTGVSMGPVPRVLRQYRRAIVVGVVALAVLILVLWGTPGIGGVIWLTVGALLLLGLIEIVARAEGPPSAHTAVPAPAPG